MAAITEIRRAFTLLHLAYEDAQKNPEGEKRALDNCRAARKHLERAITQLESETGDYPV